MDQPHRDVDDEECYRNEHVHKESNGVSNCPKCARVELIIRDPAAIKIGEVYGYCGFCGYTMSINPQLPA